MMTVSALLPSPPVLRGRGVGGEGEGQPPHPRPLAPEYGGEGSKTDRLRRSVDKETRGGTAGGLLVLVQGLSTLMVNSFGPGVTRNSNWEVSKLRKRAWIG